MDISDERVRYSRRPFNRLDNKRSVEEVIENLDETVKKFGRLSFKEVENALEEVKSSGSVWVFDYLNVPIDPVYDVIISLFITST